ncbi:hypothetical protein HNY73_004411 [Argiope bruennichi]|uniref:Uncharacterized protein n=1 Tax=Argiope bruennichi TaxID=94029 RepID=A0A8T0FNW2_ARGBR|nr:hypothetical protein HNY73_004411 [Argiope bruennichi]
MSKRIAKGLSVFIFKSVAMARNELFTMWGFDEQSGIGDRPQYLIIVPDHRLRYRLEFLKFLCMRHPLDMKLGSNEYLTIFPFTGSALVQPHIQLVLSEGQMIKLGSLSNCFEGRNVDD